MDYAEQFDGIWACASLLHVPAAEMDEVFARFGRALRPGGVWYLSFKLGVAEEVRDGRLFHDSTEAELASRLGRVPGVELLTTWRTEDVRPSRPGEWWVNGLARKR